MAWQQLAALGMSAAGSTGGVASVPDVFKPEFGGNIQFGHYNGGAATVTGNPPVAASVANNPWVIGTVAVLGLAFILSGRRRR